LNITCFRVRGLPAHQKDVKIDQYQLKLEQTYDPGKANYTTHSVWRLCNPLPGLQHQPALHPFTLNEHELDQLDNIIERKKPIQKGTDLVQSR
jgi:hypothetical protein